MAEHYNAFISYRHAPLDNRVAAEVQKRLERFLIPRAIQKQTGIRKIDRIFRDKEELLITSDLNDTIEQALSNSDYLIVICSRNTKDSIWVQKEIAFFLKTHSRKQILTVLAEGEPNEVIPPVLLTQEVQVTLDSGKEDIAIVPVEPLSCDYRGDFRRARKEELPRLAAAILGCSYDQLKQRQRQYRMRRLTLAFSAAAVLLSALAGYYAWSAKQIRGNYIQALENESLYLVGEAHSLLESGDRLTAMEMAVKALPQNDKDMRPLLPEAEYALSQAVNAYLGPNNNAYALEAAFSHSGPIDAFALSEDESRLVVRHSRNVVTVWDTESCNRIFEKVFPKDVTDTQFLGNGNLLILSREGISCYDSQTDSALWDYPASDGYSDLSTLTVSDSTDTVVFLDNGQLLLLDTADGSVVQEAQVSFSRIHSLCFSPDGQTLFLYPDSPEHMLAFYDIPTDTFTLSDQSLYSLVSMVFTADGNVILTGNQEFHIGNSSISGKTICDNGLLDVLSLSPDGELLWSADFRYAQAGFSGKILLLECPDENGIRVPAVACTAGEEIHIFRTSTGELLREITCPAAVIELSATSVGLEAILVDGARCSYWMEDGALLATPSFISGLDLAIQASDPYVSQTESGRILRYTTGLYDTNWKELLHHGTPLDHLFYTRYAESTALLFDSYKLDAPFMVFDLQTPEILRFDALPREVLKDQVFLSLSPGGDELLFLGHDSQRQQDVISAYDFRSGAFQEDWLVLPEPCTDDVIFLENSICYRSRSPEENAASRQNLVVYTDDDTTRIHPIDALLEDASLGTIRISPDERFAALLTSEPQLFILDLNTGESCQAPDSHAAQLTPVWSPDSSLLFASGDDYIRAFDTNLQERYAIPCEAKQPHSMFAAEDSLYVLYKTGSICRYGISDGTLLGEVSMERQSVSSRILWDFDSGKLALQNNTSLYLIDTERMTLQASVPYDCLAFDLQEGIVIVEDASDPENYRIGYFNLYDYKDLLAMANDQLS